MTTNSNTYSMANDPYQKVVRLGFVALAWEFMRRSRAYYIASTKARLGRLDAAAICQEFGIERIKHHDEWYFEGEPPVFVIPSMYAYKHKNGGRGIRQTVSVALAPGQVAVIVDLKADVVEQFKMIAKDLQRRQKRLAAKEWISHVRERLPSTYDDLGQYCLMLRALDMSADGQTAAKIGALCARKSTKFKTAGANLIRRARSMCVGGYRTLALYGLLGYDKRIKKPRRPAATK